MNMIPSLSLPVVDICVVPFAFKATEVRLEAATTAGRKLFAELFGFGAISINLPKSHLPGFTAFAANKGVTVG